MSEWQIRLGLDNVKVPQARPPSTASLAMLGSPRPHARLPSAKVTTFRGVTQQQAAAYFLHVRGITATAA